METFNFLIAEVETKVFQELDKIAENNSVESVSECLDTIKLTLSSRLTEIRLLIDDKVRLRQALVNPRNRLNMIGQKIVVFLNGVVKNPNRADRAKGVFTVTYNQDHALNIALKNPLAIKSRDNCLLLALLAACNQFAQLRIKRAAVFCPSLKIKSTIESLALWKSQGFLTEDGTIRPDSNILGMIENIVSNSSIELDFVQSESPMVSALYASLLEVSRKMIAEEI